MRLLLLSLLLSSWAWQFTAALTELTFPPEGSINLTRANSPYVVNENLTASGETEIFIESGVKVFVRPGLTVTISGSFHSFGTKDDPMVWDSLEGEDYLDSNFSSVLQFYPNSTDHFVYKGLPICTVQLLDESGRIAVSRRSTKEKLVGQTICSPMGYEATAELLDATGPDHTTVSGLTFQCQLKAKSLDDCTVYQNQHCDIGTAFRARCNGKSFHRNWGGLRFTPVLDKIVSLNHMQVLNAGNQDGLPTAAIKLPNGRYELGNDGLMVNNSFGVGISVDRWNISGVTVSNCNQGGILTSLSIGSAPSLDRCQLENNRIFGFKVVSSTMDEISPVSFCTSDTAAIVNMTEFDTALHFNQLPIVTCTREFFIDDNNLFSFQFFPRQYSNYLNFKVSGRNNLIEPYESLFTYSTYQVISSRYDYRYIRIQIYQYYSNSYDLVTAAIPKDTSTSTIFHTLVAGNDVGLMLSTDNSLVTYRLIEARLLHNQIGIQQSDVGQTLLIDESMIDGCAVGVVGQFANVLISNSNFTNCSIGLDITTTINPTFAQSPSKSVEMKNCLIKDNDVGVRVTAQKPLESVTMKNLKVIENNLMAIHITADAGLVELKDSEFVSNRGSGTVMVNTVNGAQQGQLLITSCDFIDNSIDNLPHFQVNYGSNAVVKTNYHTNVSIHQSRFENPNSQYDVALSFPYYDPITANDPSAPFYNEKALDFTENWWGSTDITKAALKIYDRNVHVTLQSTELSPFYDSREMTNLGTGDFQLVRGNEIGGALIGEVVIPTGEYQVVGDILVKAEAMLTLLTGVTLAFPPTSTLVVHGQLISDATGYDAPVHLLLQKNVTAPVQPGFLLTDYKVNMASTSTATDFGTVCVDNVFGTESYPAAETLCKWGGFKETGASYIYYQAPTTIPAKYSKLLCDPDVSNHHQCALTPCGQDEKDFCSSCQLLAVYCQSWGLAELTWEGVELSAVARHSVIRNTKISGANGGQLHTDPSALRVGYHRHEISNVTVESDNAILISNISVLTPVNDVSVNPLSDMGTTGITLNRLFDNAEFLVDPESLLDSCGNNTIATDEYKILWLFESMCYTVIDALDDMTVLPISTTYKGWSYFTYGFHVQLLFPNGSKTELALWNSGKPLLVQKSQQLRIRQTRSDQRSILQLIGSSKSEYLIQGDELFIERTSTGKFETGLQLLNYQSFNYQLDGLKMRSGIDVSMCHLYGQNDKSMRLTLVNSQFSGSVPGQKSGIALHIGCVTDILFISNCSMNNLETAVQLFAEVASTIVDRSVISNSSVGLDFRYVTTMVVINETNVKDTDIGIRIDNCDQLTIAFSNFSGSNTGVSANSILSHIKIVGVHISGFISGIVTHMQQESAMLVEETLMEGVASGTGIEMSLYPNSDLRLYNIMARGYGTAVSCQLYGTGGITPSLMSMTVSNCIFEINQQAILINQQRCAALRLTIENVNFDGNSGGVAFNWHDTSEWSVAINGSKFTSGANDITGAVTNDVRCNSAKFLGNLSVSNNLFDKGKMGKGPTSAALGLNSDININISRNLISNSDNRLALDVSCSIPSNKVTLDHNVFTENRVLLGLVDIATCLLSMTHNTFINNSWPHVTSDDPCSDPTLSKLLSSRHICARLNATLNMRLSELPHEFHHNIFINNAKPEMYLTFDTFPPNRNWNGSHNYWGDNLGFEAAIVLENGNMRPRVTLSPVFTSSDLIETAVGRIDPVAFKSPHANFDAFTGSFISDTTLDAPGSPYEFQQDVYVPANVTLSIEKGVRLNFASRTRLLVDGTLVAVGSTDNPIVFNAAEQNKARKVSKLFRIESPSNLLQVLYSGLWRYVNARYSEFSILDICYYLDGAFPLSGTTASYSSGQYVAYVRCEQFSEESACSISPIYETPAEIWVLKCEQQSLWEGIYVRSAEDNTVLKNVEIRNAGATRQGEMGVALQISADLEQMSQVEIVRSGGSGLYLKSPMHNGPRNPTVISEISTTDIAGVSILWPRQYSLKISRIKGLNVNLAGVVQLPVYNNFNGIREPTAVVGDFVICQSFPVFVPGGRRRFLYNNRVNLWLPSRLCCEMAFSTGVKFSLVFFVQIPTYCSITFADGESSPISSTSYDYYYYQSKYLTAYETYASSVRITIFCSRTSTPFEMFVESQQAAWHDRLEDDIRLIVDYDPSHVWVAKVPVGYVDFNPRNSQGHVLSINHTATAIEPIHLLTSVEMDFRDICFMTVARAVYPKPNYPTSVLLQISLALNNGSSYEVHSSKAPLSNQFDEFGIDLTKFAAEGTVGKLQFLVDVTSDFDAEIWFDDFAIISCNRWYRPSSNFSFLNFKNVGDQGVRLSTDNASDVSLRDSYFESVGLSHALPPNSYVERAAISFGDATTYLVTSDVHISNVHVAATNVPMLLVNAASKSVYVLNNSFVGNVIVGGYTVFNIGAQMSQSSHNLIGDNLACTDQFITITGSQSAIHKVYMSNNTCSTCSSLLYTSGSHLTGMENVVTDNNFTYSPSLQGILYFYATAKNNWHNSYIYNQICDSHNKCPIEVFSTSSLFNVTFNYWNTEVDDDVVPRIHPNVDTDPFLPILRQPPQIFGLNSFACNAYEQEMNGFCWYSSPGFVPCKTAKSVCDTKGTSLARSSLLQLHRTAINQVVGGHSFWLLNETSHECVSYERNLNEGETAAPANFQQLSSVLCAREAVSSCPAACVSPRGVCKDFLCSCKPGWTGWDCLKPVCPRDCSENGECTADGCICIPGWYGDACSITRCPIYTDCISCAKAPNCGWCDERSKCIPGNAYGTVGNSTINHCKNFFFYGCTTADSSVGCSSSIAKLDCLDRFCGGKEFDEFACMRCRDIQDCYETNENKKSCRLWNETRCPGGKIAPDYSDTTRVNKTKIRRDVVTISLTDPLIYKCSFKQDGGEVLYVLVSKGNRWDLVNKTVTSAQAGGFILKTGEILQLSNWSFIEATKASLADVIDYADFQSDGESSSYGDIIYSATVDDSAIELLTELSIEQPTTFVNLQSATTMYKMVGETVRNDSYGILVHTLVLVVSKGLKASVEPGVVVFANGTYPYIETVEAVDHISETVQLATTRLHVFSMADLTLTTDTINKPGSRQFECGGGSQWSGIAAFSNESPISQNDEIIGRKSGSFAIHVVEVYVGDEFLFITGWPLSDIGTNGSYTTLHGALQRTSFSTGISIHESVECGKYFTGFGTCIARVDIESRAILEVNLNVQSHSSKSSDGGVGLKLITTADSSLSLDYQQMGVQFDTLKRIFITKPLIKFIPISGIPIPIGIFAFVDLQLSAEFGLGVGVDMSAGVHVDQMAVASYGVTSFGESRQTYSPSSRNRFALLKSSQPGSKQHASLGGSIRVGVRVEFPYITQLITAAIDDLPDYLTTLGNKNLKNESIDIYIYAEAYTGPRVQVDATICGCTTAKGSCSADPIQKPNSIQLRVGPLVGVTGGGVFLSHSIEANAEKTFYLYDKQMCEGPQFDSCSTDKTDTNCSCSCPDHSTGERKLDGSCNCPCNCPCTQCDGTTTSKMDWLGRCDCDCDDGKCCDRQSDYPDCPNDKPDPPIDNGLSPACPPYKMGPDCTDLDCSYGNGCSGHGFCVVAEDKQKTRCSCNSNFEGQRCQNVIPRAHGEPHLSTLDGFYYDFMGLGEYWHCQADPFQLRIQSRFFKDARWNASYIGGVAVKLRDVTVSVVTAVDPTGSFILRVNGAIQSSTADFKSLSNGSATLTADINRVSLEFQSGETFGWNVVERSYAQWLEFFYSLTSNYDGKTKGLCGDGDGDINNDFTGPDGKLYSNPWDFGYSWKVADGESIYHPDDKMDDRYEDKPGEHRLDPSDINSTDFYRQAKSECESQHFSLAILTDMCILDVVVTNDTENVNQQGLKASSCPNSCSGRGDCQRDNTCKCITGWSGEECNERQCNPECSDFGQCVDGFCKCQNGYEGLDCAKQTDCATLNNCTDPLHGICISTGVCQCNGGFSGTECSQTADCTSLNGCSGNGKCVNNEKCLCDTGYKGKTCDTYSCEILNSCSGHGRCDGFDVCVCNSGYTGLSCLQFACPNDCSGNGRCTGPLKCDCYAGYTGGDCATELHCATLNNCTSQGACVAQVDDMNITTEVCRCFSGYSGLECAEVDCSEEQNCSGHGWCREPNLCVCEEGYTGANCNSFTCLKVSNCFGNGNCTALDTCECSEDWSGADCSIPACNNCSSSTGRCIGPNKCQCLRGFTGSDCSTPIQSNNRYDPEFSQPTYSVTISTEVKVGSVILVLMATDRDTGDSAKISYAIAENSGWAREYFTVGKSTGQIIVTSSPSVFGDVFKVMQISASDSGYPVRSASTTVYVTIRSPKCSKALRQSPTQFIAQEQLVDNNTFVLSVATEDTIAVDSVIYSFSDAFKGQSASKYFRLDNVTGELFIVDTTIPSQRYYVGVEAAQRDLPCSAATTAQVLVIAKIDPLITTTERPTKPTSTSTPSTTTTSSVQTTSTTTLPTSPKETSSILTTTKPPSTSAETSTIQSTTTTPFVETSSVASVTPMIETSSPTTSTIITTPSTSASSTSTTKTTLTPTQSTVVTTETTTTPSSSTAKTNVVSSTSSTATVSTSPVVVSSTKTSTNPSITTTTVETSSAITTTPTIETATSTTSAIETTPSTTSTSTTKETLTTTSQSTHSTPETTTTSSTSTSSTTTSTSTVSSSTPTEPSSSLETSSTSIITETPASAISTTADGNSTIETTPAVTTAIPSTTTTTSSAVRIRFNWAVGLLILAAMLLS